MSDSGVSSISDHESISNTPSASDNQHSKKKYTQRGYECKACNHTFSRKYNFSRHMKTVHHDQSSDDEDMSDSDHSSDKDSHDGNSSSNEDKIPTKYLIDHIKKQPKRLCHALKKLRRMCLRDQREAMRRSNDKFIHTICDYVKRLRVAHLPQQYKRQMRKQKKNLRKFIHSATSTRRKRKMLAQRGGLLPLLIS